MVDAVAVRRPSSANQTSKRKMPRLHELSVPKKSRAIWWTSFEPNYVWGNQKPMWPIKPAALTAIPTSRMEELAQPKTDYSFPKMFISQFEYGCGRVSEIWTTSPHAMQGVASKRVRELACHKSALPSYLAQHTSHYEYGCGRCSTIWTIGPKTLSCPSRPRTARLAQPRGTHPDYMPCRPPQSIVTEAAKYYNITPYLDGLAKPKDHLDGPFREAEWIVSDGAKQSIPSERIAELARHRKPAEGYQPARGPIWKVGVGALNAVSSNRMEELSKPIVRDTMDSVQFNPGVFTVSEAAKKAKASPRIEELAEPIRRGPK